MKTSEQLRQFARRQLDPERYELAYFYKGDSEYDEFDAYVDEGGYWKDSIVPDVFVTAMYLYFMSYVAEEDEQRFQHSLRVLKREFKKRQTVLTTHH